MVHVWANQIGNGKQVTAIAWYEAQHCRGGLVAVTSDKLCMRWHYHAGLLHPLWIQRMPRTVLIAVVLDERSAAEPVVYVQGIHGATLYVDLH